MKPQDRLRRERAAHVLLAADQIVTKINSATTKLSDSSMQANTLTNASLVNRTRGVVIGPGEFLIEGGFDDTVSPS